MEFSDSDSGEDNLEDVFEDAQDNLDNLDNLATEEEDSNVDEVNFISSLIDGYSEVSTSQRAEQPLRMPLNEDDKTMT